LCEISLYDVVIEKYLNLSVALLDFAG